MSEFELPERPEEGHEDNPLILPVSVTISTLAVLVALVTMFGHRAANEQILLQAKASDQWNYYQAKNIRFHEMEGYVDLLGNLAPADKEKAEASREKYVKQAEKYDKDKDEISSEAKKLEAERDVFGKKENRFDTGEALLEIGLVICSMTLLTKKKAFWFSGIAIAAIGVGFAITGFLLHP
ncbi:MAG: DUF4337 domain-containing protein [Candidatus Acidiferrum sp.]|jgi:hypothetical protein